MIVVSIISKFVFRVFLLSILFAHFGCQSFLGDYCEIQNGNGAVVLTFDDKYIDEWYAADSIFSKYNWKATFCITAYGTLSEQEKSKIFKLQNNGNEIASHGNKHYNALEYLSDHSMEEYLDNEIFPSLNQMTKDGLNITSFVYPGGVRSVELDLTLFDYFPVLRGTTYDKLSSKSGSHFLNKGSYNLLVYGLGIDNHYEHFNIEYIFDLIDYARKENMAVIFYGHNIAADDNTDYVTSYNTIKEICRYVNEKGMEFLKLSELTNFNGIT